MVVNVREGGKTIYRTLALDLAVYCRRDPVQTVIKLLVMEQPAFIVKEDKV